MLYKKSVIGLGAVVLGVLSTGLVALPTPTTFYVDASNASPPFFGTLSDPYQTISQALGLGGPVSGDEIVVLPGTYNTALGEAWPLEIPSGVRLRAYDEEDKPQVGGDSNLDPPSGSEYALLFIDVTGGNHSGTQIENLRFLGEDEVDYDAPAAILIRVDNGYVIEASNVSDCEFERSEMDDGTAANDSPCLLAEVGDGELGSSTYPFQLARNEIEPTARGGIEVVTLDAGETGIAFGTFVLSRNRIELAGAQDALFGIRIAAGIIGTGVETTLQPDLRGNTVDSSGADSGHGIETGIDLAVSGAEGKAAKFAAVTDVLFIENTVLECLGDGVRLTLDTDDQEGSFAYFATSQFERNELRGNGGAGLHADFGTWDVGDTERYIHIEFRGNLIVDNAIGIHYENGSSTLSQGGSACLNDTIAGNGVGLQFDGDLDGHYPGTYENVIVYENGGTKQVAGSAGWDPDSDGNIAFSDWKDLAGASWPPSAPDYNIDEDPLFVGSGDYHLTSGVPASPCIDLGDSTPAQVLPRLDMDYEDRANGTVDMGADEYHSS